MPGVGGQSWVRSRTHPRRKGPRGATKPRLLVNKNLATGDAPIKRSIQGHRAERYGWSRLMSLANVLSSPLLFCS
jgi:hypothetical protein